MLSFAGYLAITAWRGKPPLGIVFPLMIVGQQAVFLFNQWIVFGENGVLLGLSFVPWNDCRMQLDEATNQIVYSHSGTIWPPRFPLENRKLAVPAEEIEAIRAILAEKQPEAIVDR